MAHSFNIKAVIKATLRKLLQIETPLIFCTDTKFLYNCLDKLEMTQEKRLIIDSMSLCQLYERRKITKTK